MAQDGQKNAYNMLLNEIGPYIRSTILPTLSNPDWADDITQNVLISVHKSLSTYSASRPFIPWLRAIIKFRRYDYLRKFYSKKELKKTSLDNPDFLNHHVTNPAMTDEYIDIERALDTLPVKQSSVFKKLKIEGRSINEVADEMGMSESAVKVSAHRTIKKLQDILR
ncbi:MAG: sigma-70 family RNA polymerase sigma factor [Micavibrio sp.]|nr:sigma-70 family RNA polymerase sigma factor [Micavibrio sp.]